MQPYASVIVKKALLLLCAGIALVWAACNSQNHPQQTSADVLVGGGCDGCELIYSGMPARLSSADTAPDWNEPGPKLMIRGTVFRQDGSTPAPDVVVYYYHTDQSGHYAKREGMPADQTPHGYIRGWVKTGPDGHYTLYTNRPAPYPDRSMPAHIHVVIKEPGINEYYIDDLVFDDDSLLTPARRDTLENRGGSGILRGSAAGGMQVAAHNFMLGQNIPDYPNRR